MIRKANVRDIEDIMKIIKRTVEEMHTYNNTQWDENYPRKEDFINDIQKESLFVLERERHLAGFVCINKVEPAEYGDLNWTLNEEAAIVHRMAVNSNYRRIGIGTELLKLAERLALKSNVRYLKTDTYSVNTKMNSLFKKCDYKFIGEINFLGKEKPFNCYEKILDPDKYVI
ncbi:GNAT family N-acetyltransferase [Clostridium sp. MT-14]|jgi:GNAT superfamily N-acetyltransferase|uniref:GNAT family N-acetyltransferase n=1 Tax=Clostridium aromativorans TaxID=2836848 RepID=A0ABS8N4M7_9CLOT|nr:GNAT family N-acetyltransferase [Clostridium aromativorans]MCC9294758.1 GNAT family N-acetyltransferase [Clostridium aromativorans]CAB1262183.1 Acetyltransferase [Clostridiaceae bacterium BL-3]